MTRVTSKYGPRRRRMHKGIDLKVQIGDTIRAAFDGKVRIKNFERRGYGYYLVIRHPNGLETVYGHLSKFLVGVNDIVRWRSDRFRGKYRTLYGISFAF